MRNTQLDPTFFTENIHGFPRYHVTRCGRVFFRLKNHSWRERKLILNQNGRLRFCAFNSERKRKNVYVHKAVLLAYGGERPKGFVACHNDGNALNNSINNLRWDTLKNNSADMEKHGTLQSGQKSYKSKIKNENVQEILDLRKLGLTYKEIGSKFNVSWSTIFNLVNRRSWKAYRKANNI